MDDEIGIDSAIAWEIASKIVEMCDRLNVAHAVAPGAQATWGMELDGRGYQIVVTRK